MKRHMNTKCAFSPCANLKAKAYRYFKADYHRSRSKVAQRISCFSRGKMMKGKRIISRIVVGALQECLPKKITTNKNVMEEVI